MEKQIDSLLDLIFNEVSCVLVISLAEGLFEDNWAIKFHNILSDELFKYEKDSKEWRLIRIKQLQLNISYL